MVVVFISLLMALVMMAVAAATLAQEHRGEMYRRLKNARRGHFENSDRS